MIANRDDLRDDAAAFNAEALRTGRFHGITRRARKDGSLIDVELLAAAVVVDGTHVGYHAIYHDVSELQRQKQYYESLLETSPAAIVTTAAEATVTSWNPAAERLFGYTRDEAIGRNIDDLVGRHGDVRPEAEEISMQVARGGQAHLVTRRTRSDGSLVDVDLVAAPIFVGGEQVGFYAIYSDVSELQQQKQYYASLLEVSPTAIATVDRTGNVRSWNEAAEQLFGYSREEAIGSNIDDLVAKNDQVHAEARDLTRRGGRLVTRRIRKDGSLVDVDVRAAPIVVGGELSGVFALYHDISELVTARREAEAATQAKTAFLATMSHEIRTPMNAVIGMTELLLGTDLDDEQRSFADIIRTSGEALVSVINDILDFSKIEAGRLDLDQQPFDLRECVESAIELVASIASDKGLDLAYLLEPQVPEAVVGDAGRLRQILLNLLNNAVKFTESGEVTLTVNAEPVQPDAAEDLYRIHFAVTDTGIGIPEEQQSTLFESFTQVDASTMRRYGGTGLGLAISKRLTEAMGGGIWLESRPGAGSTFHFTLEVEAAPTPHRPFAMDASAPLSGRRLLIVDDNATNRHILRAYAEAWAMIPRAAASPEEALEWIRRGDPFDLAILDMQMPDMDGLALASEIRRHRGAERLPLVLLTSLGRREEQQAARGEFTASLTKPIRPSQLYDLLLDVFGEAAAMPAAGLVAVPGDAVEVPAREPLRVLVAEDNVVNQRVAVMLLQKLGHQADVVGNGVEALDALDRNRYDVVLMDVQMPEMDGLETTRHIHERLAAERPRVIAATAGAMDYERERCLAAGMDDYLSKPIRLEELSASLAGVAGRAREQRASEAVDTSVLDRLASALESVTALSELIETFLVETPALLASLRRAVADRDAEALRRTAHTLKSNGATFGAEPLSALCRQLEALGEAGTLAGADALVADVLAEYEQVSSALREHGRAT